MTTYIKSGSFGWAGGGKGGAVVDLWAASRFTGPPAENDAPPAGNPDAGPVTTGTNFGNPGAYVISGIATVQDYYVRVQYGGNTYWGSCPASTLGGVGGGTGFVTSVTAGDASIVVGGTPDAPTIATGTLDVIAADHPPAADWSNNSHKILNVANGSASDDVAAFGQIPLSLPPGGTAGGDLSGTYPNPTVANLNGVAAVNYVTLTGSQTLTNKILTAPAVTSISGTATNLTPINNAVTVTSNAGTVPVTSKLSTFTNSSAATMAITIATASAVDGQPLIVRIYDFSAAAETIGWTNTENSTVSVPTTSNGSTTLPLTVGFMFNSQTTKWRCVAVA